MHYILIYNNCIVYFVLFIFVSQAEKFQYISTEHPEVTYINTKYLGYANLTSQRYGRHDPFYYVGVHWYLQQPWHNNVTVDFYFYEWLTNVYKRGFVEMHFKFCDLIHNDNFFGSAMRQGKFAQPCPFPPGAYHLYNMTIPIKQIPPHFPFRKGRIQANITATETNELIGFGHVDMEIKDYNSKRRIKTTTKYSTPYPILEASISSKIQGVDLQRTGY